MILPLGADLLAKGTAVLLFGILFPLEAVILRGAHRNFVEVLILFRFTLAFASLLEHQRLQVDVRLNAALPAVVFDDAQARSWRLAQVLRHLFDAFLVIVSAPRQRRLTVPRQVDLLVGVVFHLLGGGTWLAAHLSYG